MRRLALLTAAALVTATLATPVLAQRQQPADRITQAGVPQGANEPHLVTLDFKGGTLEQLVDALKAASPDRPVNVIYGTEAADIPVPPFEVRNAELNSTLMSLSFAASGTPTMLRSGRQARWMVNRVGDDVYAIQLDNSPQYISTPRGQMLLGQSLLSTAVHTITELTTGDDAVSADDVLSAIQAALAIEGADDETKIRYHEETGLIFARVTSEQGNVIEQTLVNLRRSMEARKNGEWNRVLESLGVESTMAAKRLLDDARQTKSLFSVVEAETRKLEQTLAAEKQLHDRERERLLGLIDALEAKLRDANAELANQRRGGGGD